MVKNNIRRVHLIISGDVQGVGFRAWAARWVKNRGITGWVKNREDGTVETVAEGEREVLRNFVAACHHGPEIAWVTHIDENWSGATEEFLGFQVLY